MDIGIGNPLSLGATGKSVSTPTPQAQSVQQSAKAAVNRPTVQPEALQAAAPDESTQPVEEAVTSIQNFVQNIRRDLSFSLDDSSGRVVVKVTDSSSGEVIRQLPSEEALRLAESLEDVRSLLFKAEA